MSAHPSVMYCKQYACMTHTTIYTTPTHLRVKIHLREYRVRALVNIGLVDEKKHAFKKYQFWLLDSPKTSSVSWLVLPVASDLLHRDSKMILTFTWKSVLYWLYEKERMNMSTKQKQNCSNLTTFFIITINIVTFPQVCCLLTMLTIQRRYFDLHLNAFVIHTDKVNSSIYMKKRAIVMVWYLHV